MQKFLILIVFAFSSLTIWGQNSSANDFVCPAETVEKVSSRGIKIGAKMDDVLNNFDLDKEGNPQIRNAGSGSNKDIGLEEFVVRPKPNDKRFEGVSSYFFQFLDDELVGFVANYTKPKWKNVNQFTETLVKILGLPNIEKWSNQNDYVNGLQCGNYRILLTSSGEAGGGTLSVEDTRLYGILEQRKQKLEDEIREKNIKAFKP